MTQPHTNSLKDRESMSDKAIAQATPTATLPADRERRNGAEKDSPPLSRWVPGEAGIWGFILTDITWFAIWFLIFAYQRTQQPEVFQHGHQLTSLPAGVLNTFFMLTASLFVALAVNYIRRGRASMSQAMLVGAGVCGVGFVANKYFEWGAKIAAGHTPYSDHFFQLYYVFTGMHLVHVLAALAVVVYLWRMAGKVRQLPTARQLRLIENGASYWHMVDLIWLALFALFYLTS
jgi:nitric oxide reductase NorE protein